MHTEFSPHASCFQTFEMTDEDVKESLKRSIGDIDGPAHKRAHIADSDGMFLLYDRKVFGIRQVDYF